MTDRPRILCMMTSSLDGRLHPSGRTRSPDGTIEDWSAAYEAFHDAIGADAWLVGRTTMAEMAKGEPHRSATFAPPPRPMHLAPRNGPFAVALDRSGKLHFAKPAVAGDSAVVLLGPQVAGTHLAEPVADGISYIVAEDEAMALPPLLATLRHALGVDTLMIEGGGVTNGAFLAAGMVDELIVFLAPALDGAPNTAIVEAGETGLAGKVTLSLIACDPVGAGALRLRYAVGPDEG